jgi:hypothetical protein
MADRAQTWVYFTFCYLAITWVKSCVSAEYVKFDFDNVVGMKSGFIHIGRWALKKQCAVAGYENHNQQMT